MPRNKYPEQTVEKILDAAALLFLQKGYQNTTLQDIIDATKLSKGAVYHHFRSKEEIAQSVGPDVGAAAPYPGRPGPDRAAEAAGGVCSILCRAAAAADRADFAAPVQQPAVPCHGADQH